MTARYSATALASSPTPFEYLTQHAPAIVADFADAIERGVMEIAGFPFSAQETEMKGVRRKYIRRFHYRVFYAVLDQEIIVLHIRHAAQRLPWEDDDGGA